MFKLVENLQFENENLLKNRPRSFKKLLFLFMILLLVNSVFGKQTVVINYNVFKNRSYVVNQYGSANVHEVKGQDDVQTLGNLIDLSKAAILSTSTTTEATFLKEISVFSDEEVLKACRICKKYKQYGYLAAEPKALDEAIPIIEKPAFGADIFRAKRSFLDQDEELIQIMKDHPNGGEIRCSDYNLVLKPIRTLSRKARSAPSIKLGELQSELPGRKIGLCETTPLSHNVIGSCQHWFSIYNSENSTCAYLSSCGHGYHLDGSTCSLNDEDPKDFAICSDLDYLLSSSPSIPSSSVPEFLDPQLCLFFNVRPAASCPQDEKVLRQISLIGFNRAEHLVSVKHSFLFNPDYKSLHNYICEGCSNMNSCTRCLGDAKYVASFPSAPRTANCHCRISASPKVGSVEIVIQGAKFPVDYKLSKMVWVTKLQPSVEEPGQGCPGCTVICSDSGLRLVGYPEIADLVKVCYFSLCSLFDYSEVITVPTAYNLIPTKLKVTVFSKGGELHQASVTCKSTNTCDVIKCHLCWEKVLNPSCYGLMDEVAMIVGLIVLFFLLSIVLKCLKIVILVCTLLTIAVKVIRCLLTFVVKLVRRFLKQTKVTTKRVYRRIENLEDGETVCVEVAEPAQAGYITKTSGGISAQEWKLLSQSERQSYISRQKLHNNGLLILTIFVLILAQVSACSMTKSYNFTSSECAPSGDKLDCKTTQLLDVQVGSTGADACLLLSNNNEPLGAVQVSMTAVRARCAEEFLYWTYETEPLVQTNCHCWGEVHCNEPTCSETELGERIAREEGIILNTGPGVTACTKVKSEWLGKCVLPMDGCCFYSITFPTMKPSRTYKVSWCPTYYWEIGVKVKTMFEGKPVTHESRVTVGVEKQIGDLKILATQVSSAPAPIESECLIYDKLKNLTYLAQCNKPSEMILGKIGEIQCRTEEEATSASTNCSWNIGMVSIQKDFTQIVPSVKYLKVSKAVLGLQLPIASPSFNFKQDSFGYYVTRSLSETFNLRIELPTISMVPHTKQSGCTMKSSRLSGCYNCLQGSIIDLTVACTSYPTLATVSCPSLSTAVPVVLKHPGKVTLRLILNKPNINEQCSYTAGRTSGNFQLQGVLLVTPIITDSLSTLYNESSPRTVTKNTDNIKQNALLLWKSLLSFMPDLFQVWLLIGIFLFLLVLLLLRTVLPIIAPAALKTMKVG